MKKTGTEQFTDNGKPIGLSVLDFWKFSYSELNSDPRDDIAEYLVSIALDKTEPYNKRNWTLFDIEYGDKRIEVKSTSYYQTWRTDGKVSKQRCFSIRKAMATGDKEPKRQSDVYVFCLLNGETEAEADPLKLENWDFYIVPTKVIDEKCGDNKTVSLARIKRLGYEPCPFSQIRSRVDAALSNQAAE